MYSPTPTYDSTIIRKDKPLTAREQLRARLNKQLKASEFRFLNEKLYRADDSSNVLDETSAKIYHEGTMTFQILFIIFRFFESSKEMAGKPC